MFIVLLKFTGDKAEAGRLMAAHKDWIEQGFAAGVFVLVGSLPGGTGGALMARGVSMSDLKERVGEDPFVREGVVSAEIIEIEPGRADPRLRFLADDAAAI
ncbi:YciI family protein [Alloalcanivorax xenomutans]|jgi:uncharacterized protein YciI|uniref:YciI family protein n=1 Tax=Alloalcanivorax xenomutans TaxID=1094342 RepID=UPI0003B8A0F5|nr:YciI family protein [Alloalcanivorax xenomutans]ERS13960.1 hypothetical protein Q668_11480 [Alcanivorax sp. PN-3]MBA4721062.1 hypothetical protein [Alcanivorax sp.]PHS60039.1 MAG: hypothetical protein COB00_16880 [Alcanivorax sp.]CUR47154.1 hypothetical protein BN2364_2713 [Alloalcanivorax xenomutans]